MRLTDVWQARETPTLSFELFPARTEKAEATLVEAIDSLADLEPDFVSVTFGAGGSTREGSRQLIHTLIRDKGLEVIAYFAGYGLAPAEIISVLDSYESLGVENVLIVRGDPPRDQDFEPHAQSFQYAYQILQFVRSRYDFCFGVAGYPEGHIDASSKDQDIEYLKLKVDQGADYIICNYFYDNAYFYDFCERCQAGGIDLPILPGIMPIYSVKMLNILANLCGATITEQVKKGIEALPAGDQQALLDFGIDYAVEQCVDLLTSGVPGLHLYTMDRSPSTAGIVTRLRQGGHL